jgi:hypothetical protein
MSANIFADLKKVIEKKMTEKQMVDLIKANNYDLTQINSDGNTPLMIACNKRLEQVALALIATGRSNPELVNNNKDTALILSLGARLENVAIALIETGESNPKHKDFDMIDALYLANLEGFRRVSALLNVKSGITIDVTQTGFDPIIHETKSIKDHLSEDVDDNIVIKFAENYFLTTRGNIYTQISDEAYIKYACKTAGDDDTGLFWEDSNIILNLPYFSLSAILGIQGVVFKSEIQYILDSHPTNLYAILPTGKKLVSIISVDFINGSAGEGADHCQTGKETDVYKIV